MGGYAGHSALATRTPADILNPHAYGRMTGASDAGEELGHHKLALLPALFAQGGVATHVSDTSDCSQKSSDEQRYASTALSLPTFLP